MSKPVAQIIDEEISVNFLLGNKLGDEFNISLPESEKVQELGYEKFLDAERTCDRSESKRPK